MSQTAQIGTLAEKLAPRLIAVRRELHMHPELSDAEFWTTEQLRHWLADAGIPILPLTLKTGLVAEVRGGKPGPLIALRTDIDALPIHEETGLAYASQIAGCMHACGHDFHTSVILGAALILQELAPELPGTVRLFFQPAEELATGAKALIAAGAMEGVTAIFGLHNKPDLPAGTVGIKEGPLMAATDTITIAVTGRGGHAAIPDATVDPVVAASAIVMALQTAISRSISPLESAVVTIGSFQAGSAHNVIPASAALMGTVRTFTPEVRRQLPEILQRIVRDVASGYGASAALDWSPGTPAVTNDPKSCGVMREAAQLLGMDVAAAVPTMGGEDFAAYQQMASGCFVWLGTGCPENWHHPCFTTNEDVIHLGAALFAQAAVIALKG
jgi:amidohydrolase